MIAFISGHLDLTQGEFDGHYAPHILQAIMNEHDFVVGDARGADAMAQAFLKEWVAKLEITCFVTVYHMLQLPRHNAGGFKTIGGYLSNTAKDKAMTLESDYDILYIRPSKHSSVSGRVSGTEANQVRRKVKEMKS